MSKKEKDEFQIPNEALERLARVLFPEIQKFFDSDEGKREFEEWQRQQERKAA